jgi:hypothetical protein
MGDAILFNSSIVRDGVGSDMEDSGATAVSLLLIGVSADLAGGNDD